MKTEKELKEEIEEHKKKLEDFLEDLRNNPEPSFPFLMGKNKLLIDAIRVETQLKTLKERNTEVEQAIEELPDEIETFCEKCETEGTITFLDKQKLLQKLGLGKGE